MAAGTAITTDRDIERPGRGTGATAAADALGMNTFGAEAIRSQLAAVLDYDIAAVTTGGAIATNCDPNATGCCAVTTATTDTLGKNTVRV